MREMTDCWDAMNGNQKPNLDDAALASLDEEHEDTLMGDHRFTEQDLEEINALKENQINFANKPNTADPTISSRQKTSVQEP